MLKKINRKEKSKWSKNIKEKDEINKKKERNIKNKGFFKIIN